MRQKLIKTRKIMFNFQQRNKDPDIPVIKLNFIKKNFDNENCLICLNNNFEMIEDTNHLFVSCPISKNLTMGMKNKIKNISKLIFKKDFPDNLIWFDESNNNTDFRTICNFDEGMGAIGLIPAILFEKLSVLSQDKNIRKKFLREAAKIIISFTNFQKYLEHRKNN